MHIICHPQLLILQQFQIVVNKPQINSGDPIGNIRLIVIPFSNKNLIYFQDIKHSRKKSIFLQFARVTNMKVK